MAFISIDPYPPTSGNPGIDSPDLQRGLSQIPTDAATRMIVDSPQIGSFRREMVTWRTPHLGFVKMYINPQQMKIEDKKDITPRRTKGGFVIQYAGEGLTQIHIDGTTGSSGIEGINILSSVYRSEQQAFEGIAIALEEQLASVQLDTLINSESPFQRINLFQMASNTLRNLSRPQPTLASLATQVEMFFQGVLYRGYFKSFSVTEVAEHMGLFTYSLHFEAYAKQGTRRNFMPWHRQPYNPANADANPFSFTGTVDPVLAVNSTQFSKGAPSPRERQPPRDNPAPAYRPGDRSRATGTSSKGQNQSGTSFTIVNGHI